MTPQQSNSADALYRQGNSLAQTGRFAEALAAYDRALAIIPGAPEILLNRGNVLFALGRHPEAVSSYETALARQPDNALLWTNLGNALAELGRNDQALSSFTRALQMDKGHVDALMGRATLLSSIGRDEEALHEFNRALDLAPGEAEIHHRLGVLLLRRGMSYDALRCFDFALQLEPGEPDYLVSRAAALTALKNYPDAVAALDAALRIAPSNLDALVNRASVLSRLKTFDEALASADRALLLAPNSAAAWHNRGVALAGVNRTKEAIGAYRQALSIDATNASTWSNCAVVTMSLGDHAAALADFDRALALNSRDPDIWSYRAKALANLGRFPEAEKDCASALALHPENLAAHRIAIHARLHACDWSRRQEDVNAVAQALAAGQRMIDPLDCLSILDSAQACLAAAKLLVTEECPPVPGAVSPRRQAHHRIRVGYLSTDFRAHIVGAMMAGVFERHDKARIESFAFSLGRSDESSIRTRIKAAADRFVDLSGLSDGNAAKLIRELEPDILVDLNGHTGQARTGILAHRPAPVQINFLGYPGSSGAPYVDYIIADRIVIPETEQSQFTERVLRLPDCYQPNDRSRSAARMPSRAEAGLPESGFVFCCFNNNYKIAPDIFEIWMRLLRGIDDSILWLLADNETAARNLRREAQMRGVSPDRLVFAPRASPEAHLARHTLADLFLDTAPYNAHTTATDSLWMGTPVVTRAGSSFQSRVAASVLTGVGAPELITNSASQYEQLAFRLARDPAFLDGIRTRLRTNRDSCALFDIVRFTRNLERIFLQVHGVAGSG